MNTSNGKIVVGVDGSPASVRALRWALGQAELTGAEVKAVYAWQVPAMYGATAMSMPGEQLAEIAESTLDEILDHVVGDAHVVPVSRVLVQAHPAKALLEESEGADLLVVGSRGHGGFVGALIGSVSQQVVQHATCPVVVVRAES